MALQISHNQIYLFQIQIYLLLSNNYGSCTLNNSIQLEGYKNFVVDEGHGVKGLSDIDLQTLPKQYIQPTQEQISTSTILTEESIPVIDMSNSNEQMVADMICNAAEKWGFFQIVNHGIPVKVLENVKNATHRFYGLPAEGKKYSKEESPTNNVRYGTSFSPQPEEALGWKDWLSPFYVSDEEATAFCPSICRV